MVDTYKGKQLTQKEIAFPTKVSQLYKSYRWGESQRVRGTFLFTYVILDEGTPRAIAVFSLARPSSTIRQVHMERGAESVCLGKIPMEISGKRVGSVRPEDVLPVEDQRAS